MNTDDMIQKGRQSKGAAHTATLTNRATGKRNGAYTRPEQRPRGDDNGMRRHPESVLRGESNGFAKFSNALCEQMKSLHAQGYSYTAVAKMTGSSRTHCTNIIKGHVRIPFVTEPQPLDLPN